MAVAVLIAASGLALQVAWAQQPATKRIDLQRHDLSIPGRETIQAIVEIAPGQASPRHTHPGEEIIYVLEGTLEYEIDGKVTRVKPGDVLFVPAGTPHLARNPGTGRGAELATYVVEKGKPLITIVERDDRGADYDKQMTALLVIDPYNDFISEGGKVWDRLKVVAEANGCVPHMVAPGAASSAANSRRKRGRIRALLQNR